MTAAPLHLLGTRLLLDPLGALFWPDESLLAVADLHFEKGSAAAERGQLVPPWDTRTTLEKLALVLRRYGPRTLVALGDTFHDRRAAGRMHQADRERLAHLAAGQETIWLHGNHDPDAPEHLPGHAQADYGAGKLVFRHIGRGTPPAQTIEICGHHHPKATIPARAAHICRPCFVTGHNRVMLPAFGAYTGGLDIRDNAIACLFPRGGRAFLLGRERLFSFGFERVRG